MRPECWPRSGSPRRESDRRPRRRAIGARAQASRSQLFAWINGQLPWVGSQMEQLYYGPPRPPCIEGPSSISDNRSVRIAAPVVFTSPLTPLVAVKGDEADISGTEVPLRRRSCSRLLG